MGTQPEGVMGLIRRHRALGGCLAAATHRPGVGRRPRIVSASGVRARSHGRSVDDAADLARPAPLQATSHADWTSRPPSGRPHRRWPARYGRFVLAAIVGCVGSLLIVASAPVWYLAAAVVAPDGAVHPPPGLVVVVHLAPSSSAWS